MKTIRGSFPFVILGMFVAAGTPLAYALGAATVVGFIVSGHASYLQTLPQRIFSGLDVFAFMAMPLFILSGELMERTGVTQALVDLFTALLGKVRGALGYITVTTAVFLSGVSGSGLADAAVLSSTLVPEMVRRGYSNGYAGALTVAASVIGPLIPPSIVMVLYGAILNVSLPALFAAGIGPGLLVAVALGGAHWWYVRRGVHTQSDFANSPPFWPALKKALPALSLPMIVVGGIVFGLMTPTEAAAVTVFAAVVIGIYYRQLTARVFYECLVASAATSGSICILLAVASCLGLLMVVNDVSGGFLGALSMTGLSGISYLLLVVLVVFAISVLVDNMIALTLVVPVLAPKAVAQGADPVHVGIVLCFAMGMAIAVPPLGGSLLVVSTVTRTDYHTLCRSVLPFVALELAFQHSGIRSLEFT